MTSLATRGTSPNIFLADTGEADSLNTGDDPATSTFRFAYIACSAVTAACALVATGYWYLSSRPMPAISGTTDDSISDAEELHILNAQVEVYGIQATLAEASRLNKKAAIWSAIAALFGAAAAILGIA